MVQVVQYMMNHRDYSGELEGMRDFITQSISKDFNNEIKKNRVFFGVIRDMGYDDI